MIGDSLCTHGQRLVVTSSKAYYSGGGSVRCSCCNTRIDLDCDPGWIGPCDACSSEEELRVRAVREAARKHSMTVMRAQIDAERNGQTREKSDMGRWGELPVAAFSVPLDVDWMRYLKPGDTLNYAPGKACVIERLDSAANPGQMFLAVYEQET